MTTVEGLPNIANAAMRNAAFVKAANTIAPAAGKFPLRNKLNSQVETAKVALAKGDDKAGFEKGEAQARQVILNNKFNTTGTKASTEIKAGTTFKEPHASAFAINRDPIAVEWDSGSRELELDLSGVTLAAQTGTDARAWTSYYVSGRFVDDTLDIETSSIADPLFEMTLSLFTQFGSAPQLDLISFTGFGNSVSDSDSGIDSASVQSNFAKLFTYDAIDNLFKFSDSSYRIFMNMDDTADQSVLYLDQYGAAVSLAVPETSNLLLLGMGMVLGFSAWRMRSTIRKSCH